MSEPWSDVPSAGYWEGQFLMAEERIRTLEAALEKWKNADLYTGDEYRTLEAEVERLQGLLLHRSTEHLESVRRMRVECDAAQARVRELAAALSTSRGQWIHSVNAEQCLAALREPTLRSGRQEK